MEVYTPFPPVLATPLSFVLLYYSIEVSLFCFSILLTFVSIVDFSVMQLGHSSPFPGPRDVARLILPDVPLVI